MTGRCVCKPGIQGQKCTICSNHEHTLGPNGCFDREYKLCSECCPIGFDFCAVCTEDCILLFLTAESTQLPATNCDHMTCYFGAHCVVRSGLATCECGTTECPPSDGPSVCGSDGRTYLSACHLRTHACRTQSDVVVQAFGPCSEEAPHVRRGSRSSRSNRSSLSRHSNMPLEPDKTSLKDLEYIKQSPNSLQFTDASVDTSDSGKPDSPEPDLTCIDILPPIGYR